MLGYMRSYAGMGDAQVECTGCSCERTVMHGTWEQHTTLIYLHKMTVRCTCMASTNEHTQYRHDMTACVKNWTRKVQKL
jgi:hypothetical protein